MNLCRYFLCFAVFSFIGWAYESAYYTIQRRKLVNSGFLSTCFCPIYGIGALLDLLLLGWIENACVLFVAGIVVTGVLEYFVSWMLEALFGRRWWDYTGWPLNINGRVCALGALAFGIMTVLLVKFIAPFTIGMISNMSLITTYILTAVIAFVMVADTVKSVKNTDNAKLWYVEKQAEIFENFEDSTVVKKIKNVLKR